MKEKGSSFSGSIGFVLAAAGSAVGVGNIWRFPYLCAKDGGGLFLLVYLVLVLTFGFVKIKIMTDLRFFFDDLNKFFIDLFRVTV